VGYERQEERRHNCGVLGAGSFGGSDFTYEKELEGRESNISNHMRAWEQWDR
jgi:hypothetical protein